MEQDPLYIQKCPVCADFKAMDCPRCHGTRLSPVMWLLHPESKKKMIQEMTANGIAEVDMPVMQSSTTVPVGRVNVIHLPLNITEMMWMGRQQRPFTVDPRTLSAPPTRYF